jgi:hypothetical protein
MRLSKLGKKASEETKQKMRDTRKGTNIGNKNPMYGKPASNRKKVLNLETEEVYESLKNASESLNIPVSKAQYWTIKNYKINRI